MATSAAPEAPRTAPAETPGGASPDYVLVEIGRLAHLENVSREYGVTITTLGIVVEKYLALTGEDAVRLDPSDRLNPPDLRAGQDSNGQIWIKVFR